MGRRFLLGSLVLGMVLVGVDRFTTSTADASPRAAFEDGTSMPRPDMRTEGGTPIPKPDLRQ